MSMEQSLTQISKRFSQLLSVSPKDSIMRRTLSIEPKEESSWSRIMKQNMLSVSKKTFVPKMSSRLMSLRFFYKSLECLINSTTRAVNSLDQILNMLKDSWRMLPIMRRLNTESRMVLSSQKRKHSSTLRLLKSSRPILMHNLPSQ